MSKYETLTKRIDSNFKDLSKIARDIWEHPEIALKESFASNLLANELEKAGFKLEHGVGDLATAFIASWGEGKPIIGLLGEYDALPGLSQSVSATREPIVNAGPGHGCGHNLFGTAAFGAAVAVKELMENEGITGTIRFYGCPAEETLVGKTFMARAGVFDDLDAAITWHPGSNNMVINSSSTAMNSFKVNFHGAASHAAAAPHLGRSALDGAQLMDIGVNYLREHVIQEARMHSVISSGGQAPNVVPAYAQIWYYVRAPKRHQVDEIYARVLDIAKGAALMSGTSYDIDFVTGCYDYMPNKALTALMFEHLKTLEGSMSFSDEEKQFAKELQASFPQGSLESDIGWLKTGTKDYVPEDGKTALNERVLEHSDNPPGMAGSTEVGDVSHICPTVQMTSTCWPLGTPAHSWQTVASSGSSIGMKGMLFAAKALGLTALDLFLKPDVLKAARAEFDKEKQGEPYVTPIPEGVMPH
ncbi:MAG: amidohydrolase [Trueperaceae bacterium]|nr:amidohydrolase [Trueperaceae bacterium]